MAPTRPGVPVAEAVAWLGRWSDDAVEVGTGSTPAGLSGLELASTQPVDQRVFLLPLLRRSRAASGGGPALPQPC